MEESDGSSSAIFVDGSVMVEEPRHSMGFTFQSHLECMTTCNITRIEWCPNIEVGIKYLIQATAQYVYRGVILFTLLMTSLSKRDC
jgi:hypothetical protein